MKSYRLSSIFLPLVPALAGAWESPSLEGRFGSGAGFGVQRYSGNLGDQGSFYGRLQADYHPTEWLSTRLVYGFGNIGNGETQPSFTTETFSHLGIDLALQPQLGWGTWRPYLLAGLATTFGTSFHDGLPNGDLDGNLYVPMGIGTECFLTRELSLWASLETYLVMSEGDRLDGISRGDGYFEKRDELQKLVIGATYRFGRLLGPNIQARTNAVAPPLPGDRDGDGIRDDLDRCPNTSAATLVDSHGCPSDSDRDGVPDLLDDCPSTPIGNKVDEFGCTLANDKDHDGIPDAQDKCPNTARSAQVDPNGCPLATSKAKPVLDSDQDGVPDAQDRCPGTSREVQQVDSTGCMVMTPPALPIPEITEPSQPSVSATSPAPEPLPPSTLPPPAATPREEPEALLPPATTSQPPVQTAAKPKSPPPTKPEKDSDKDGVPDSRDRCRSTAMGSRVDSTGCAASADPEADSDKDGVRDIGDQCPNSKYGMKVDATGCQVLTLEKGFQAILEGVQFQPGTARLLEESLPILEHLARVLKRSSVRVEIAGFTERRGPEAENLSLSQRRAEVVKEHLVTIGAESSRLSVRGYGSAEPIADNAVEAGRLRNRRIELRVR